MELKQIRLAISIRREKSINRTFMELKQANCKDYM